MIHAHKDRVLSSEEAQEAWDLMHDRRMSLKEIAAPLDSTTFQADAGIGRANLEREHRDYEHLSKSTCVPGSIPRSDLNKRPYLPSDERETVKRAIIRVVQSGAEFTMIADATGETIGNVSKIIMQLRADGRLPPAEDVQRIPNRPADAPPMSVGYPEWRKSQSRNSTAIARNRRIRDKQQAGLLPSKLTGADTPEDIAHFIAERGVTQCPAAWAKGQDTDWMHTRNPLEAQAASLSSGR